jgi:hypothetical protein
MSIKNLLGRKLAKITGRECRRCAHNCGGKCTRSRREYMKCWHSITRPGFKERPGKYLKTEDKRREELLAPGRAAAEGIKAGMEVKPAPLTPEQQYQLEKIKATLQQAEDAARESGLLTED